ncbi:Lrp/AsnC family transcriptional regulator [Marinobacter salinexigens]|uniref:siroheme decarboxylase n=1 Tax=Marinobacter salinexigens TaxID=2919747 RepID=A0A5B0VNI5_9GAMM|nr:Lrp/AsnC family transcriptional regulator [Marinobacter salinexigens]KAA1175924.1 Lrp/AsnC family transcriptional regulator [Marinobacter salinexigens]
MSVMTERAIGNIEIPDFSDLERKIINRLQHGLPMVRHPYAAVAEELGTSEQALLDTLKSLLDRRILSRFGPMFHAGEMGGGLSLVAMRVPEETFDRVVGQVNAFDEVAHNYRREHELNMWFVVATETPEGVDEVLRQIEETTGFPVYNMPKEEEFHVRLHFKI